MHLKTRTLFALLTLLIMQLCSGCSATPGNIDPWENTNRVIYNFNDGLDRYALKPLADGYVKLVPKPLRTGLDNGFNNLGYFNVVLNDFLQGQWNQGWSDSGRMAVNSTIGIAGIFDVATLWNMPSHDNDFGITLGKWGAPSGPYLVLPLFGPSTVRDVPGIAVGIVTNPLTWVDTGLSVSIPLNVVQAIDMRAEAQTEVRFRDEAAIDPYVFTRHAYMQYREGQIHGEKTTPEPGLYDDDFSGPATQPAPASAPAATPATSPAAPPNIAQP